jgi:hypothetical protein
VVVAAAPDSLREASTRDLQRGAREVLTIMLDSSLKPKARAKAVAKHTGLPIRDVYARLAGASHADTDDLVDGTDEV